MGGGPINQTRTLRFNEMLTYCSLIDLGFSGPRFTWSNLRNFPDLVQERLDRAVANPDWKTLFPEVGVTHLPRVHSDHCPILVDCNPIPDYWAQRPFRFETMWLSHPDFQHLVFESWEEGQNHLLLAISYFQKKVVSWNKNVFGNVFHRKKRVLARLAGIQRSMARHPSVSLSNLEKELRSDYNAILEDERELWLLK